LRVVGEGQFFVPDLLCAFGDIQRVIRDALKIGQRMQEERNILVLLFREIPPGQFDKVGPESVLVFIDARFEFSDLIERFLTVFAEKPRRRLFRCSATF